MLALSPTGTPDASGHMPHGEHSFLFSSLDSKQPNTARKVHLRRLFDVLHLCIQRHDWPRARRAWAILARCKEVDWKTMWRTSLLLLGEGESDATTHAPDTDGDKVGFLTVMMRQFPEEVSNSGCTPQRPTQIFRSRMAKPHPPLARVHPEGARIAPDTRRPAPARARRARSVRAPTAQTHGRRSPTANPAFRLAPTQIPTVIPVPGQPCAARLRGADGAIPRAARERERHVRGGDVRCVHHRGRLRLRNEKKLDGSRSCTFESVRAGQGWDASQLRNAQAHFERARAVDPSNVVADAFLNQVTLRTMHMAMKRS